MAIEIRTMVTSGQGWGEERMERAQENFLGDKNVIHLHWGDSYKGYIIETHQTVHLKIYVFYCI